MTVAETGRSTRQYVVLMDEVAGLRGLPEACVSADLVAATDLLVEHIKSGRISAVLNRSTPELGSRSLIELAVSGDTA